MAEGNGGMPQLDALAQYVKDLSFENPNAPRSLQPKQVPPAINVQVNVNAKELGSGEFEVDLSLEGSAGEADDLIFRFELVYSGIFRLVNIPAEHMHQVVMIECPRMLFPFARCIVGNAVRDGGFPPFLLQPIDFGALYQQRMVEMQNSGATARN
ncbi:MAG: protein-export chaperone SecB [Methylobacterium sp.]|jgi:preprotein translocase subunit SecB|nr:protein-export chaperone SecB [Methylobacterium sp.]MCA3598843.1 protein-export chaperone SecB [Methylobacterium sp.]MCA3600885.1 protein-export chaperone SecB [Methylobacterium sp.]MCA3602751.1 protein-export chaperone SecB [Methylobacterium sp.]MCA3605422.1 protein-export chaperone SecB [Methylobacterium sp.]